MTAAPSSPDADVVCLGESMVTFRPAIPGPLADVPSFDRGIGGAESNVACSLARTGHTARWISRVGADGFGEHLVTAIAATGVDTASVQHDPHRPTGIYFRTAGERAVSADPAAIDLSAADPMTSDSAAADSAAADSTASDSTASDPAASGPAAPEAAEPVSEVVYYRAGSAASAMSPDLIAREQAWSGRILHLTGITAALSDGCRALLRTLTARAPGRPLVSFDVNYRVGLWHGAAEGPAVLLDLARGCDLVFVGEDEAEAAWGLRGADAIRAALPEPEILVVKQGAAGATAYARTASGASRDDTVVCVPALAVDVVASVGAGDAFAAGFLSGTLRGLPLAARLRHGHLMAAAALTVPGDLAAPPARRLADRLAALDPDAWGRLRLGPGWASQPAAAEAETVRVEERTA
ncbi:sugar kinase [Streptomyces sp. NPDC050617]|uniref:sugar kinase n=1 Tax=Streptomyces sp. NPDC050617 TaxID=3154628 RepID=UPI003444DCA6